MTGKNILSSMWRVSFFSSSVCLESLVILSSFSSSLAVGTRLTLSTGAALALGKPSYLICGIILEIVQKRGIKYLD